MATMIAQVNTCVQVWNKQIITRQRDLTCCLLHFNEITFDNAVKLVFLLTKFLQKFFAFCKYYKINLLDDLFSSW